MTRDGDDEDLGALAPLVRELPREVAPPPDLWKAIAARLEPRGRLEHLAASLPMQVDPPEDLWPRSRRASFRVDGCDTPPSRSPHPSPSRQQSRSACSSASTTTRALSAPWRPSRRTIRQVTVPAPRSISVGCSAHRRLPAISRRT